MQIPEKELNKKYVDLYKCDGSVQDERVEETKFKIKLLVKR